MSSLRDRLTPDLCAALEAAIRDGVGATLATMFGCRVERCAGAMSAVDEVILATVSLRQGVEALTVRLAVEQAFVGTLIAGVYPRGSGAPMADAELCRDASSELANLFGNQVKHFLNGSGFLLYQELPVIEPPAAAFRAGTAPGVVNVNFAAVAEAAARHRTIER